MTVIRVIRRRRGPEFRDWFGRRPLNYAKPPNVWVRDCDREECADAGRLHTHGPAPTSEPKVLAALAEQTALTDPWTAATNLFGGPDE